MQTSYPAPTAPQPHTLGQVTTTGPSGTTVDSFTYDLAGDTRTRTVDGAGQTLTWDSEGRLTRVVTDAGQTTDYVYDADGNRLIARTDTGSTLYLGGTEVTAAKGSATAHATRYYDLGDGNQAMRTDDNKVYFLVADSQGTGQLQIDSASLALQQRRTTPFGALRGTAPAGWTGDRGFVGGVKDPGTGLTHLGARDYDPATGRFISVDPELDSTDPQPLNGYAYAGNDPVTQSDPTGLYTCRNGHEGCNEHGNACGSDCSAWATQAGDCVHTECGSSKVNQNPDVSLKKQREVRDKRRCHTLCQVPGHGYYLGYPPMYQNWLKWVYGGYKKELEEYQSPPPAQTSGLSYSYTTKEYIGPNSLGDPKGIMAFFMRHPHEIFPFKVTGCGDFEDGAKCTLHPAESMLHGLGRIAGGPGEVTVSVDDPTSFTFTVTNEGYFDRPGSQIKFSISSNKKGIYLTQKAHTTGSSLFGWLGVKTGMAKGTWKQQARNLTQSLEDHENILGPDFGMDP